MSELAGKARALLKKGKYVLAVALLGVLLILWPRTGATDAAAAPEISETAAFDLHQQERELEELLSDIRGAGKVRVMLSLSATPRQILARDERTGSTEDTVTTVTLNRGTNGQEPVVLCTVMPEYRGAVVVLQGGDDDSVRLAVVRAVAGITGLGSDKIVVVKMKEE